jgi:UDP-N-acetyl-D-mannosaminuronic acid dehydrogenase
MNKFAIVSRESTIKEAVNVINQVSTTGGVPGIAVVLDSHGITHGVITDGDVRKLICQDISFDSPLKNFVSNKFVFAYDHLTRTEQLDMVHNQFKLKSTNIDPRVSKVILCDADMRFKGIVNLMDLYLSDDVRFKKIAVYGMGYVGLTLALTLAESTKNVFGVDVNPGLVKNLNEGQPPFFENGLSPLLEHCQKEKFIEFKLDSSAFDADIFIIAVGTPVDKNGNIIYSYLESAGENIGKKLKQGSLIICRSTVPLGTTRNVLIPSLEKMSGLKAGKDFHVAFAPERTVEGNALKELRTLPQVIGGFTKQCAKITAKIFEIINPTIVHVESLEAAEMVKLINNTFRDTVFSFANDISLLCDEHNINAFDLIKAANEGYPRNPIPLPSPGVGGICLVKDPYLFENSKKTDRASFGSISRKINERMPRYVFEKFLQFEKTKNLKIKSVLVVGLAFKGLPETSDTRFSPAVELAAFLKEHGVKLYAYDAVVPPEDIKALGMEPVTIENGIKTSDAVFFMNNHPNHKKFDFYKSLAAKSTAGQEFLFFDGWNQFNRNDIESIRGITFSTLGYITSGK